MNSDAKESTRKSYNKGGAGGEEGAGPVLNKGFINLRNWNNGNWK